MSDAVKKRVEKYLKKEFPKKTLLPIKEDGLDFQLFGFGGLQILVVEQGDNLLYKIIKK